VSKRVSRRAFLGIAGAGLASAGAAHLWIPRRAFAAPGAPVIRRLLILHAAGGARTTCLFNGNVSPQNNPFGVVSESDVDATGTPVLASGVQWGVGRALLGLGIGQSVSTLTPRTLSTWGGVPLPYVSKIADKVSVLGAVDHDPTQQQGDTDHYSATRRMCTGAPGGSIGLLTILSKELASRDVDGQDRLPPVVVGGSGPTGASVYGTADRANARFEPILLNGPSDFQYPRASAGVPDPGWATSLESQLDDSFVQTRPNALGGRAIEYVLAKQLGLGYGATLAGDALRISYTDTTLGTLTNGTPVSNAMLAELFGMPIFGQQATFAMLDAHWGGPTALGVRLLQSGAPVVAVGVGGWDLHSGEETTLPRLAGSLGSTIAALYFLFSQLQDDSAPGRTWWDTTLIVFTSEFGRDNTADTIDAPPTIGFNRVDGSDHHGTPPCRFQALPIMGGGVPGGRMIGGTDEQVNPIDRPFASASLLATMAQAMGVDADAYFDYPVLPQVWE
jgi:hypothetical protein